jgi:ABC-type branched-subunit amino acid transport system substrate-binding protein
VPALAASGHMPAPVGAKKPRGSRPVLLVSTAEGLDGRYLAEAGRYSEGALFAPGYFPDDQDPASKQFLDDFLAAYGRAPKQNEAYAYDAALLAASSSGGRAALAATLAGGTLTGLTGTIQFDANHLRADEGVVYTVVEGSGAHVVRVAR